MAKREPKMIVVTVIVSGNKVELRGIESTSTIRRLAALALAESGNTGQPVSEWEVRTADGYLLEYGISLEDAGVVSGQTLYLSPRAGVGGGENLPLAG